MQDVYVTSNYFTIVFLLRFTFLESIYLNYFFIIILGTFYLQGAMKTSKSSTEDKIAGRESDNLRYLALEPPMQRKRRSPYVFNHNIVQTETIEYPNGAFNHDNGSVNGEHGRITEEQLHQSPENVRKKLHFEQSAPKPETVNRIYPVKVPELKDQTGTNKKGGPLDNNEDNEIRPRKKMLSPAKEQRKRDLREIRKKQDERVREFP